MRVAEKLARRDFTHACLTCGLGAVLVPSFLRCDAAVPLADPRQAPPDALHEAIFWEPAGNGNAKCLICPNQCVRKPGEVTFCNTRINKGGRLYSLTYGLPCVLNTDPVQKNPLFHVDPGAKGLGMATAGCNLRCSYCQNWDISQVGPWKTKNMDVPPAELVRLAGDRGLKWLTFSYTDPVAYLEYALASAQAAHKAGMRVAVVTAGMISPKPLAELVKHADAFSVTLKGSTASFYQKVCASQLKTVWRAIEEIHKSGRWVEVVHLIVPTLNDKEDDIKRVAGSVNGLSPDIPLHLLRFSPAYKLAHLPRTPIETLEKARALALKEGLRFVYLDLPGHEGANTYCPRCHKTVIERSGFTILANRLQRDQCPECRAKLPGLALAGPAAP